MKLLLDENLSFKLKDLLSDVFPELTHVRFLDLLEVNDYKIWEFAKAKNYVIVSKDIDFLEINLLRGFPPKVIWLNIGNSGTKIIENILRKNYLKIKEFIDDKTNSLLILK